LFDAEKLLLTLWTIVRSTATHDDFLDRGFAGQARLAFTAISAVLDLKEARFAIGIDVIRDR
jgi:hypothetical protein